MDEKPRCARARGVLLLFLCLSMVGLQGCGLGWLYMRIGDSHRIRGAKILEYDTTDKRFKKAQEAYRRAIDYYKDSLLYDQVGNMDVYHKFGYTYLQLSPPDLDNARQIFEAGLKLKREKADRDGHTDALNSTADDDYSQMNAGMGTVLFYTAIAAKKDEMVDDALKYYAVAEATSSHPTEHKQRLGEKILDWMNLTELLTPVPPRVLAARVFLYRAKKLADRGHGDRAKTDLASAKEAIEDALGIYPDDPRAEAELARLEYQKGEWPACLKTLAELKEQRAYADQVENSLLKGRALIEAGKPDQAIPIFTEIHERFMSLSTGEASGDEQAKADKTLANAIKRRNANVKETEEKSSVAAQESAEKDPVNMAAMVGRAYAYAAKGDLQNAQSDVDYFLRVDPKDPRLYLDAGKVFITLKSYDSAAERLLKGYYIDSQDIAINFYLAKAYDLAGKKNEAREVFARVISLDPTSSFASDARAYK